MEPVNALILGPLSFFPKAAQSAGLNVTALWGGGTRTPREADELLERRDLFLRGRWIDSGSWSKFLAGAGEIARVAFEREIDLIHANGVRHLLRSGWAKHSLQIRYGRRVAVAVSLHNPLPWTNEAAGSKRKVTAFLIQRLADLAIPIADFNCRGLAACGVNPEKIVTAPVCIDTGQFERRMRMAPDKLLNSLALAEGEAVVSYVAALNPVKGHRVFIRAAEETLRVLPRTKFLIVGDGACRADLEAMVCERGLQHRIIFTGNASPRAVAQIFGATTLSVCASFSEMMPMAVIEALTAGKPVVATRVGGIPELVRDGITGFLIPPGDPGAFSRSMQLLLRDESLREQMGRAGREHILRHHSLPVVGKRLLEAYRRALALAGTGAGNSGRQQA